MEPNTRVPDKTDDQDRARFKHELAVFVELAGGGNPCHIPSGKGGGQFAPKGVCSAPGFGLDKAKRLMAKLPKDRRSWKGKGNKKAKALAAIRIEKAINEIGAAIDQEVYARIEACSTAADATTPGGIPEPDKSVSRRAPGLPVVPPAASAPAIVEEDCKNVIIPTTGEERTNLQKELLSVGTELAGLGREIPTSGPALSRWAELSIKYADLEGKVNGNKEFNNLYSKTAREVLSELRPVGKGKLRLFGDTELVSTISKLGKFYPDEWIKDSNKKGVLSVEADKEGRGWFSGDRMSVDVNSPGNIVHEIGHRMAHTRPWIINIEDVFYSRRTIGYKEMSLRDVAPGSGYDKSETTKLDKFLNPYMGNSRSHEAFTMGVQMIQENAPIYQDKDYARFILGTLAAG